jgi:hypothetical protein
MGEFLDRALQHDLLMEVRNEYPRPRIYNLEGDETGRRSAVNLAYLREHGLIAGAPRYSSTGDRASTWRVAITAKGLDFLADDGGLGAILGVMTVRLHEDTLRELLLARVDADGAVDAPTKGKLKQAIQGLPSEVLKTIASESIKTGLAHVPQIVEWLRQLAHIPL